jgi:hypothetical protein
MLKVRSIARSLPMAHRVSSPQRINSGAIGGTAHRLSLSYQRLLDRTGATIRARLLSEQELFGAEAAAPPLARARTDPSRRSRPPQPHHPNKRRCSHEPADPAENPRAEQRCYGALTCMGARGVGGAWAAGVNANVTQSVELVGRFSLPKSR